MTAFASTASQDFFHQGAVGRAVGPPHVGAHIPQVVTAQDEGLHRLRRPVEQGSRQHLLEAAHFRRGGVCVHGHRLPRCLGEVVNLAEESLRPGPFRPADIGVHEDHAVYGVHGQSGLGQVVVDVEVEQVSQVHGVGQPDDIGPQAPLSLVEEVLW